MRGSWEAKKKKKVRGGVGASQRVREAGCANWKPSFSSIMDSLRLPGSQGSRPSIQWPMDCPAIGSKVNGPRKLSILTNA